MAVVLAAFVLPSALNVPQSNPTQTLEFAPVPPEGDEPPPPDSGNADRLGLGSSSTVSGDALGGDRPGSPPPPDTPEGLGDRPVTKRCVGDPPRQTEDPLSPPCVAHFDGDNGGATYQGVTGDEIRILLYLHGSVESPTQYCDGVTSRGMECKQGDRYIDLWEPFDEDDQYSVRIGKIWQRYFNERFQLYGRRAHFWIYFNRGNASKTPEGQRADALANIEKVDPFAFLGTVGDRPDYVDTMLANGVMHFGSRNGAPAEYFRRHPGLIWSFDPSLEQQVTTFVDYVCTKVVGYPVSFDGNGRTGDQRTFALLYPEPEFYPDSARYAMLAREGIAACGGRFVEEGTYPVAYRINSSAGADADNRQPALANIAAFQQAQATTVIWGQGWETRHTGAASQLGYLPEWVIAGDRHHEGNSNARAQDDPSVLHRKAWVVTPVTKTLSVEQTECFEALSEAAPDAPYDDKDYACIFWTPRYEDLRQLFTGIQVAGPRLTPETVERGLRAIPAIRSTDPAVPACFYVPGDYTCVKDAMAEWWDNQAEDPAAPQPGCWRMAEDGQRYFAGDWPEGDVLSSRSEGDPCNSYTAPLNLNFGAR